MKITLGAKECKCTRILGKQTGRCSCSAVCCGSHVTEISGGKGRAGGQERQQEEQSNVARDKMRTSVCDHRVTDFCVSCRPAENGNV